MVEGIEVAEKEKVLSANVKNELKGVKIEVKGADTCGIGVRVKVVGTMMTEETVLIGARFSPLVWVRFVTVIEVDEPKPLILVRILAVLFFERWK